MTRVAFVMTRTVQNWNGGVNYLRNLVHAIRSVPGNEIEPVLVVPPDTPDKLIASFPPVDVLRSRLVDRAGRAARRATGQLLGRDLLMERLLRANDIQVLSHSDSLGKGSRFPTIAWLTDFQHHRLPGFCSAEERAVRDRQFRSAIDGSTLIVLSSKDAQNDLASFAPAAVAKSRVLHFVSGTGGAPEPLPLAELERRYAFQGPFFHLPNQFWAHKNHRLVLDALARLKAAGVTAQVLATGSTEDYRHPDYFGGLMAHAAAIGVHNRIKVLGVVPYPDMVALMHHAVAVINPSRFEGWSSTVEECKSFGLRVLLSDIPVHREQAPSRGSYFSPDDPEELAQTMARALAEYAPEREAQHQAEAMALLHERFVQFGRQYADIVAEAIH